MFRPVFWSLPAGRLARTAPAAAGLALAAAVIPAGAAAAQPSNCSQSGSTVTCTFTESGAAVTWPVPAGLTSAALTLYGGSGGSASSSGGAGGAGAEVTGTVALSGISSLTLNVAGAGGDGPSGTAGYGGGGASGSGNGFGGGGGGGGATTVSGSGGTLLVAGGGGGGGQGSPSADIDGGSGGNADTAGQSGQTLTNQGNAVYGGGGGGAGTQTAGGAGGDGGAVLVYTCAGTDGITGSTGSAGQGGDGTGNAAGAGGGGGYFGGGQGGSGARNEPPCDDVGANGGGGGGSSFTGGPGVSGTAVNDSPGAPASLDGNGEVIISYQMTSTATATTVTSSANPSIPRQAVTYTATVSPTDGGGSVAFADGGTPVSGCTAQSLNSNGQATCQVTYSAVGSHAITAVYSGDTAYAGSTSTALTQQVVADKADLKVSLSVPAQASDGTSVTETVTVTNQGPATASKVVTALTEPGGLTVTGADGAKVTGPVLTWNTASLAPGASVTFTVTANVGAHARGTVLVAAGALSATPDPDLLNNAAIGRIRLA
jgi:Bacterial Ig-like domain (group 3)/Domain of unknown function DUF11